jgi:hypothetical protein
MSRPTTVAHIPWWAHDLFQVSVQVPMESHRRACGRLGPLPGPPGRVPRRGRQAESKALHLLAAVGLAAAAAALLAAPVSAIGGCMAGQSFSLLVCVACLAVGVGVRGLCRGLCVARALVTSVGGVFLVCRFQRRARERPPGSPAPTPSTPPKQTTTAWAPAWAATVRTRACPCAAPLGVHHLVSACMWSWRQTASHKPLASQLVPGRHCPPPPPPPPSTHPCSCPCLPRNAGASCCANGDFCPIGSQCCGNGCAPASAYCCSNGDYSNDDGCGSPGTACVGGLVMAVVLCECLGGWVGVGGWVGSRLTCTAWDPCCVVQGA